MVSGIPQDNFILLSINKNLDLACSTDDISPSDRFESMINRILQIDN